MAKQRGKKIDRFTFTEGAQRHEVDLRLDHDKGDLFAELGGVEISASTLVELKAKLREHAKQMVSYEYKWYIIVDYDIDVGHPYGRRGWSSTSREFGDVGADDVVSGVNFRFHVVERSQEIEGGVDPYSYSGAKRKMYMERPVEEVDGKLQGVGKHDAENVYRHDSDPLIEFTPERYAKLVAIRDALREVARRLHLVVGGKPTAITKMLDAMPAAPLQLAAESTVEPAGKKTKRGAK